MLSDHVVTGSESCRIRTSFNNVPSTLDEYSSILDDQSTKETSGMATIAAAQPRSPGIVRPQYFQPDAGGAIPSSPRTPNRTFSSALSSPSIAAKSEEDPLIIEFGARYLRAGFARDRLPMCSLGVGPAEQRRAGDYRYWEPGYTAPKPKRGSKHWTDQYELWPLDLRTANLGLVEDKVERLVRSALTRSVEYHGVSSSVEVSPRIFLTVP